ncbi:MAG TPA: FkbM family methyltransferase [Solirubrobacteraceae bacterium]|nr:FkbM family methyltransferase [Solirubrobacteraceae bacterium]
MSTQRLAALPAPVQDAMRLAYVAARVTADRRSLRTFARLWSAPIHDGSVSLAPLRVRPLGGEEVLVRPGTSDISIFWDTFARRYHLPPPELGTPQVILDLGANIGLTMAYYAYCYPHARVLGVELDADNVALARRNTAAWANRCEVIHAAVWQNDGVVHYRGWPGGTSGYHVTGLTEGTPVRAMSIRTLLREYGGQVDYMKVDVEGAERELLQNGVDWADNVRCLKVELHGDYASDECEADLRRLGYKTRPHSHRWSYVIGLRSS